MWTQRIRTFSWDLARVSEPHFGILLVYTSQKVDIRSMGKSIQLPVSSPYTLIVISILHWWDPVRNYHEESRRNLTA